MTKNSDIDGVNSAHRVCADAKQRTYTVDARFTSAARPPEPRKKYDNLALMQWAEHFLAKSIG